MKSIHSIALACALTATSLAFAGSANMKDMDMKGMNMSGTKDQSARGATHQTMATVKGVDAEQGKVTLAHEPVKSLNWPAMTMGFKVKDKAMLQKMPVGEKVQVEFVKQGSDYVVTSVK